MKEKIREKMKEKMKEKLKECQTDRDIASEPVDEPARASWIGGQRSRRR